MGMGISILPLAPSTNRSGCLFVCLSVCFGGLLARYISMPQFRDGSFICNSQLCVPQDAKVFEYLLDTMGPYQPFVYEQVCLCLQSVS